MSLSLPRVLAVLLPLVVGSAMLFGVARFEPFIDTEEARELKNAGKVLNGRRLQQSVADSIESGLEKYEPDVLILGNSYANTNIDPKRLAKALGVPHNKLRTYSVPNSVGSHWYAMFKNRIFDKGHAPALIVVISGMQSMLLVQPYSESSYQNLAAQMNDVEPLLDQMVPRSEGMWRDVRENRGAVREVTMATIRDASVGLVYGTDGLAEENDKAMARVFHDRNVDMSLYGSALPIVQFDNGATMADLPHPKDSMLPHLCELAAEHGTKLVFLRSPMAPRTPPYEMDAVPEGHDAAARKLVESYGHSFMDLSTLYMQDAVFFNPGHMTKEGAKTFTLALIAALEDQQVYGPPAVGAFYRIDPPVMNPEEDPGPPATLEDKAPHIGGRWVHPGESLTIAFPEAWERRGYWRVQLTFEQFTAGSAALVELDGKRLRVQTDRAGRRRPHFSIDHSHAAPGDGPWNLVVTVPADGGVTHIEGLRVGRGPGAMQIIGYPENHKVTEYDLLGQLEVREGLLQQAALPTFFAKPPPAVPRPNRPIKSRKKQHFGRIDVADLTFLSDEVTIGRTPLALRCSPVRVLEDGVEVRQHHESCSEGSRYPVGRACHGPDGEMVVVSGDGQPVSTHDYSLVLDEERECGSGRWLYPGDHMRIEVSQEVVKRFRRGAHDLVVQAVSADGRPASLSYELRAGERILLQETLVVDGKEPVSQRFGLDKTLWPDAAEVELRVHNQSEAWMIVTQAALAVGPAAR